MSYFGNSLSSEISKVAKRIHGSTGAYDRLRLGAILTGAIPDLQQALTVDFLLTLYFDSPVAGEPT